MKMPAICNNHYNRLSLIYLIDSLKSYGVSEIELCPYASYGDIRKAEEAENLAQKLNTAGLHAGCIQIEQGGVVPFNPGSDMREVEDWSIAYAERLIANMKYFGAGQLVVAAGRQAADLPFEAGWERSRKNLTKLGTMAAEAGVELLLAADGANTFSNLVCSAVQLKQMLDEIGLANVKAYVDPVSTAAAGEDFDTVLKLLSGRIGRVCLADGPDGFLLPGDGTLVPAAWKAELEASGYAGEVTLRLQHWRYDFEPHRYTGAFLAWADANGWPMKK